MKIDKNKDKWKNKGKRLKMLREPKSNRLKELNSSLSEDRNSLIRLNNKGCNNYAKPKYRCRKWKMTKHLQRQSKILKRRRWNKFKNKDKDLNENLKKSRNKMKELKDKMNKKLL